ncbi:MAG: ABC transporter substrate-binding protein [Chloroflexi bacterium]|nr:ABC transporter substrate-binding protein [Chloroflexota bacterium]
MSRNRRSAIPVLSVVLGLLIAGCAPAAGPSTPRPGAPAETAAPAPEAKPRAPAPSPKPTVDQPRYGGVLTLGTSSDAGSLDPITEGTATFVNMMSPAYDGLLQYDPSDNEKIVPDLAERWELSGDGMAYTFYLRKDVKWHDGKQFTSADVKFSLENQPKYYPRKRDNLSPISAIETAGEYSVRAALKFPSASLPAMLALGNMSMVPKHIYDTRGGLKSDAVGTGPFKLKNYSAGIAMELVKNKEFFVAGRPYLDGISIFIIRDRGTFLAAFRTERIKMPVSINNFSSGEAKNLKNNAPQTIIQPFQALRTGVFFMNTTQKPWTDIRVRRAVFLAVDRQAALQAVGEGEGTLGGAIIAGQWAIPQDELQKQPGFRQPKDADLAEAKRLMAEAGHAGGFDARIMTRAGLSDYLKVSEFMTNQLSRIGVRATADPVETAVYAERLNRGTYETAGIVAGPEISDPDSAATYFVKGNRYLINDDRLFELFEKQSRTTDVAERKKVVLDMQYRVMEIAPYVLNLWFAAYIGHWPEVRNYKPGTGVYNNSKYQDVWLAK